MPGKSSRLERFSGENGKFLTFSVNTLLLKVVEVGALFAQVFEHLSLVLTFIVAFALRSRCRVQVLVAGAAVVIDFTCEERGGQAAADGWRRRINSIKIEYGNRSSRFVLCETKT